MRVDERKAWFRVKRRGYGVSLPVAWEGWLVLLLYLAAIILSAVLVSEMTSLAVLVVLTPVFLAIAWVRSDQAWRWRDGA